MRPVLTPAEMAAADRATIGAGNPSLELMETAGRAVAVAARTAAGGSYGRRIVVVCGKGNNAGDGFVAARHLGRWGAHPVVVSLAPPASLSGDTRINATRLAGVPHAAPEALGRELALADAVVDAVVGTGFRGMLRDGAAAAVQAVNASGAPVVAVDIPSGVDGTTGAVAGPAVRARVTVTMGALKAGLVLHPGRAYAGRVEVVDIGIRPEDIRGRMALAEDADVRALLPARPPTAHKRSVGTVLVVAGSVGMTGAAVLSASGALRAGAGLVTVATPSPVAVAVDTAVLEATTLPLPETGRGSVAAAAVDAVAERAAGMGAVAIGPGLGTDPSTVEAVRRLVGRLDRPLVLDADGITAVAGWELPGGRPIVLTPHAGELARVLGTSGDEIERDRVEAARWGARRTGAVVLLKGSPTVVVAPGGDAVLVDRGGPALATGGTGDVLTGVTAALLAAGIAPFEAAWAAAWLHGAAGDLAAERHGIRSTIAGDLLAALPDVLREVEQR